MASDAVSSGARSGSSVGNETDLQQEVTRRTPLKEDVDFDMTPERQAKSDAYDSACFAKQYFDEHHTMIERAWERRRPDGTWAPDDEFLGEYLLRRGHVTPARIKAEARAIAQEWRQHYHISTRKAEELEADAIARLAANARSRGQITARRARAAGQDVADPDESIRNPLLRWYRVPAHESDPEFRYSSVRPREEPKVLPEAADRER